jgi:hypothetical protein
MTSLHDASMSAHAGSVAVGKPKRPLEAPIGPAVAVAATCAAAFGLVVMANAIRGYGFGVDSLAYWSVWHHGFYTAPPGARGAYLYSPAFAQATWPLTRLPWAAFAALWSAGVFAALVWLLWPLRWPLRIAALALVSPEIIVGNVWAFYAVVLVIGFRWPQAWAFPLLTKVTAGVGFIWFAVRREWRSLATAAGCALLVAGISFAIEPGLWTAWISYLSHHQTPGWPPPLLRLPVAVVLAVVGAHRDRPAWLVWAVAFGSPVFGPENFVVLAALPRLHERRWWPHAGTGPVATA